MDTCRRHLSNSRPHMKYKVLPDIQTGFRKRNRHLISYCKFMLVTCPCNRISKEIQLIFCIIFIWIIQIIHLSNLIVLYTLIYTPSHPPLHDFPQRLHLLTYKIHFISFKNIFFIFTQIRYSHLTFNIVFYFQNNFKMYSSSTIVQRKSAYYCCFCCCCCCFYY